MGENSGKSLNRRVTLRCVRRGALLEKCMGPADIEIRRARPEDSAAIAAVLREAFAEYKDLLHRGRLRRHHSKRRANPQAYAGRSRVSCTTRRCGAGYSRCRVKRRVVDLHSRDGRPANGARNSGHWNRFITVRGGVVRRSRVHPVVSEHDSISLFSHPSVRKSRLSADKR